MYQRLKQSIYPREDPEPLEDIIIDKVSNVAAGSDPTDDPSDDPIDDTSDDTNEKHNKKTSISNKISNIFKGTRSSFGR